MDGNGNARGRRSRATRSHRRANRGNNGNNSSPGAQAQEPAAALQQNTTVVMDTSAAKFSCSGSTAGPQVPDDVEESMSNAPNRVMPASSPSSMTTAPSSPSIVGASANDVLDSDSFPRYPVYNNNRIYASPNVQVVAENSTRCSNSAAPSHPDPSRRGTARGSGLAPPPTVSTSPSPGTRRVRGVFGYHDIPVNLPSEPPAAVGFFERSASARAQRYAASGLNNAHREQSSGSYNAQSFAAMWNNGFAGRQQQIGRFSEEQRAMNLAMRNLDQAVDQSLPGSGPDAAPFDESEMDYGARLRNYSRLMERSLTQGPAGYNSGVSRSANLQHPTSWRFFEDPDEVAIPESAYETIDMPGGGLFAYTNGEMPISRATPQGRERMRGGLMRRLRAYEDKYHEALAIKLELQTLRISLNPISNSVPEKAECEAQTAAALQQCETQAASWRAQVERIDRDLEQFRPYVRPSAGIDTTSTTPSFSQTETGRLGGDNLERVAPTDYLPTEIVDRSEDIMHQGNWRNNEGTTRREGAHGAGRYELPNSGGQERARGTLPRRNPRNQDGG